jgi:hypothetical protein
MQDKFNQFFNQNNNISVEKEDASALDQCMDLAFAWCDTLGIPRETIRHPYAHQIWDNPSDVTRKYFDLIPNEASNKPAAGDIIVFKVTNGIPVGHVSLETGKSDTMNVVSFDQNWDTLHYYHIVNGVHVPYSRLVVHQNYYGVAGWLHPKIAIAPVGEDVLLSQVRAVVNGSGDPHSIISQLKTLLKT